LDLPETVDLELAAEVSDDALPILRGGLLLVFVERH
jgi:hypothetical protein